MLYPFTVIYEQATEIMSIYSVHAASEQEAIAAAESFFAANPLHDPRRGLDGLTVRVEKGLLTEKPPVP